MLNWLMNFTEGKVTHWHWCFHSVFLVRCIVPVTQCLCIYNPLQAESLREGVMSHLPLFSYCQAQYLVQSGNSINTCLMLLNISGSRTVSWCTFWEFFDFPDSYISRADQSLLPTVWLVLDNKKHTIQICSEKAWGMCQPDVWCFEETYFLDGEPEATRRSPDLTTVSCSCIIFNAKWKIAF